jgi:hypothetical protein
VTRYVPWPARLASTRSPGPGAGLLAAATMVNTLGNGVFLTTGVRFFTLVLGLPVGQVGLG